MKTLHLSRSITVGGAMAALFCLAAPAALFAAQPGPRPACVVGKPAHPSIQSAVDDLDCRSVNVPPGVFHENVTITRDVTIRGAGSHITIVNGGSRLGPVFSVDPRTGQPSDIDVTLEGMTITGGTGPQCAPTQPPCNQNGGGISIAFSVVTVKDSVITGNTTTGNGGGASFVFGALTLKNCVVSGNRADAYPGRPAGQLFGGGGLRGAGSPNVMTVIDSEITGNSSGRQGGGIFSLSPVGSPGTLIVKNSIVENNTATADPFGGGIYSNNTTLTLKDSKIAGNTPDDIAIAP